MDTVLDIDAWSRAIARAEAIAIRAEVREAITSGAGGMSALDEVRRRLARLTQEQRAMVANGTGLLPEVRL
jgi:hypothetical protein